MPKPSVHNRTLRFGADRYTFARVAARSRRGWLLTHQHATENPATIFITEAAHRAIVTHLRRADREGRATLA
jgi:hypothetical protein